MKKVLFISPGFVPIKSTSAGAIEGLMDLYFCHNDETKNFDITVYSAYTKDNEIDQDKNYETVHFRNIKVSNAKSGLLRKFERLLQTLTGRACARFFIKEAIRDIISRNERNHYDLIVIENCDNDLAYIGKNFRTKTPIVLHLHNDYINTDRKDAVAATQFLTEVWGVSDFICRQVSNINKNSLKAVTIYNAVNKSLFDKELSQKQERELKKKLGIEKDDYVFLYVGRLMPEKGVRELVEGFIDFRKEKKNIKLLIVGGQKNQSKIDGYSKDIMRIAKENESIIHVGRIEARELYKYYQLSDCQVIPSKWNEAFGLIALEGMMNGIRIISSKNGGLPEVLASYGENKQYLNEITPKEIRDKLKTAYELRGCKPDRKEYCNLVSEAFSVDMYGKSIDNRIMELTHEK